MENLNTMTAKVNEILVANNLDFDIIKAPMKAYIGQQIDASGHLVDKYADSAYYGLINSKTNEVINTCKEGYTVSQNSEFVELILRGLEKFGTDLEITKAGSLNGGRKTFIQIAINGNNRFGNDTIKKFITGIDSNDGSTGLSLGIGNLTMSCQNQFFKFYKAGESKFRHTATITQKLKEIPYLIETALNQSMKQIELYAKFQSTEASQKLVNELVKHLLGTDKTASIADYPTGKALSHMNNLYNSIENQMNDKGQNLWGLHSGITHFTTHVKSNPKRENGLIESLTTGSSYKMADASLQFAMQKIGLVMA